LRYGDWRELFNQLNRIDAVTKADIRRVANQVFVPNNRTYAMVEFQAPQKPAAQSGEPSPHPVPPPKSAAQPQGGAR
jgi:predicted Zn-dependent peptidase